jgi:MFS family permease
MPDGLSAKMPLTVPVFRRAWSAFTVSAAGDAASWIALVALCLGRVGGSLPLLAALYTAPVAVGGWVAGWALDRYDRRKVVMADSVIRAAAFASIPVAAALGHLTAIQLYVVAAVYGLFKMISLAGFPALIPSLVPADRLAQANALEGVSFGVASLVGAALAGVVVAVAGAAPVIAFDAVSYVALAVALASIPRLDPAWVPRSNSAAASSATLLSVVRLALRDPILLTTTIMFALFNIGEGCLLVFLPHRATQLGLGDGGYGYLVAVTTIGQLAAGLALTRRAWAWPLQVSIVAVQAAAAVSVLLLIAPGLPATIAGLVLLGLLSAPMTAWAQTLRMRVVPPESHGRLFAVLRTVMQATPPLGAGLGALVMPHGAAVTVLAVGGVMGLPVLALGAVLIRAGRTSLPSAQTSARPVLADEP